MVCAIVGPGNVVWSEGFGLADIDHRRPVLADTLINVGSVTKTVTATAVMQLWEQKLREFGWPRRFVTPATRFVGLYGVK
jgi:CubicO group peptidase (beta-lactamase class C family)